MRATAFYAYPSGSRTVADAIHEAPGLVKQSALNVTLWETVQTNGFKIDDLLRERLQSADVLIAYITYPRGLSPH